MPKRYFLRPLYFETMAEKDAVHFRSAREKGEHSGGQVQSLRPVFAWEKDSSLQVLSHRKVSITRLQDRDLCHCLAMSRIPTGEGKIVHLAEVFFVQEQDGYSQGFKTLEGNRCVPV